MGFLAPLALLALPLSLLPFLLEWQGRRTGEPLRFSSLYLLERARRTPAPRTPTRSRWVVLLRALVLALLVLAAARPVAPGRGRPASHRPTRAVILVDVSASAGQLREGRPAWEGIRAGADSLLAAADPDDRLALAAFADGLAGWWEAPGEELRQQLARLEPTAAVSDWAEVLAAVGERIGDDSTETYWFSDGARGARGPAGSLPQGHHVLRLVQGGEGPNRGLVGATRSTGDQLVLRARGWGVGAPEAAQVGRLVEGRLVDLAPLPLDGESGPTAWVAGDTATFAFQGRDRLPADDRLYAARGGEGEGYRIVRWAPADEPPEPGALFWEAALAAAARGAIVERASTLPALAARAPDLALLPLRAYRSDQAALLADLTARGTRLLFAPPCADPGCAPPAGWWPNAEPRAPDAVWDLGPPDRQTTLASRPSAADPVDPPAALASAGVPDHLLARAPIRGGPQVSGEVPQWSWPLASGAPALWVRGPVAVWLVPLGPPVTRLGTTPVFQLLADAALAAWDPRWAAGGAGTRVGEPIPLSPGGASVTGPLHAGPAARVWSIAAGGPPPRPAEPGIYRVEPRSEDAPGAFAAATFVAVNGDPAEGDLAEVGAAQWRAAGLTPVPAAGWSRAIFPQRRGPELWPWLLALALAGLAAEAALRRDRAGPS